jgi:predicted branched-subunit amino acid permease
VQSLDEPGDSYTAGVVAVAPVAVAVGTFGASFGVLAGAAGLSGPDAVLMSATTFAGSAQFAAVSVLTHGGSALTAVIAVALLNARYVPIGASVAGALARNPLLRFLQAQLVVDESWALATRGGRVRRRVLLGGGMALYLAFLVGTILGVLGGGILRDPGRLGLDAAFPALFLALVAPQLGPRRAQVAAGLGAVIALALVPFTPPGVPIVAAAVACLVGLWR